MKLPATLLVFLAAAMSGLSQNMDELAYAQIEKRQRRYGATENRMPLDSQLADYKRRYLQVAATIEDKVGVEFAEAHMKAPKTRFESVAQRTHISDIEKQATRTLQKYSIDPSNVYFSLVSCPCFNAQSLRLAQGRKKLRNKWLIEYNVGFSVFAQKVGIFTANASPTTGNVDSLNLDSGDYSELLTDSASTDMYFSLYSFLLADIGSALNIEGDSIRLDGCTNPVIAGSLSSGFSTFTLYHELAHVILNHHARISKLSMSEDDGKERRIRVPNYYDFEYQADSLGMEIMLNELTDDIEIFKQIPTSSISVPYILSPLIFFSWMDLFHKFEDSMLGYHRGQATHPAAGLRREKLVELYQRKGFTEDNLTYATLVAAELAFMYDIVRSFTTDEGKESIRKLSEKAKQCIIK